jgi:hypothetical protein
MLTIEQIIQCCLQGNDEGRTQALIRSVSHETHEYLMNLYWDCFNTSITIVDRETYEEDFVSRNTGYYSCLLHLCQLAMGFRFADKSRADIKTLARGAFESVFHQEGRYVIDAEIEMPKGLPTIAALLLLGDLECGVGRDNLGWMLHAMAIRIALDLRLNMAPSYNDSSPREAGLRKQTLWACTVYDCYWALFGQRPTTINLEEIEFDHCAMDDPAHHTFDPGIPNVSHLSSAYEALLELMSIAGRIYNDPGRTRTPRMIALHKSSLARELQSWYANLHGSLVLTLDNTQSRAADILLLHQQYHSILILLHWPFVDGPGLAGSTKLFATAYQRQGEVAHTMQLCRDSAVAITRLYRAYMTRFDATRLPITCVQHIVSNETRKSMSAMTD